jgi:hypothetical protein
MLYDGFQLDIAHVPWGMQSILEGLIWFTGHKVWLT